MLVRPFKQPTQVSRAIAARGEAPHETRKPAVCVGGFATDGAAGSNAVATDMEIETVRVCAVVLEAAVGQRRIVGVADAGLAVRADQIVIGLRGRRINQRSKSGVERLTTAGICPSLAGHAGSGLVSVEFAGSVSRRSDCHWCLHVLTCLRDYY